MNLRELVEQPKDLDASPVWIGDADPLRYEFTQTLNIRGAIGGLILRGQASIAILCFSLSISLAGKKHTSLAC